MNFRCVFLPQSQAKLQAELLSELEEEEEEEEKKRNLHDSEG